MPSWRDQTLLKWREPRRAVHWLRRQLSWRERFLSYRRTLLVASVSVAAIALILWLRGLEVGLWTLPFGAGVIALVLLFVDWVALRVRPEVRIRERSVIRLFADGTHQVLPREDISHYEINTVSLEGVQIAVLSLRTTDGGVMDIELPADLSPRDVLTALGPHVAA